MADEFDKVAGALVYAGVRRIPVLAYLDDVAKKLLPPSADERLQEAIKLDWQERTVRLEQRVAALETELNKEGPGLDDLGPTRTAVVAKEVLEGVAGAYGEPKVDAVLNAGARQFDPRMGPQEIRKYWLDRVTLLQDIEIRVLMLPKKHAPLYYFVSSGELYWGKQRDPADLGDEDRVALGSVLLEMMERIDLVTASGPIANIDQKSARAAILTPRGETLVRFIEPIAGA